MEVFHNQPLAPYTTVKIGGPADAFVLTHTSEEFIAALKKYSSENLIILGNGSNVLIADSGIRGTVIKNESNKIEFLPNNQVKVDSGVQLPLLINKTIDQSLTGLEEFAYIPSSIGGAIYGNIHGTNKNNFDKFIISIEIFNLQTQSLETKLVTDLVWSYDTSEFKNHPEWIIVSVVLQLQTGNIPTSRQIVTDIITQKTATQSMNSLGCIFKNPDHDSAGRIIDQELGLKGTRLGDIQISEKHANFIVNLGNGTATDYYSLIKKIQSAAVTKGFTLEPEIHFLGDF